MKISKFVATALAMAVFAALAGCAGGAKRTKAGEGRRVAYTKPKSEVSTVPRPAVTPGGMWPPVPVDEAAIAAAAPPLYTTDHFDIDADRDARAELKRRVVERWALLIAQKGDLAFDYLSPGYQQTHNRVKYGSDMASRPVRWFRAAFDHSECASEDACEVSVLVDFKVRISAGMGVSESFAYIKERWISVDGIWYHLPTDVGG